MKRILFCILMFGAGTAFCMESPSSVGEKNDCSQAAIKWGSGILNNREIVWYTEGPCGVMGIVAQEHSLDFLSKCIDKIKGDVHRYLKLIQFVLQTDPGLAWQEYEDKPGITPAQELMAFGEPDANPAIRDAMQGVKKEILSRWTFCACCGPDDRAPLEARKNALRHMLITGPEMFTGSIQRHAGTNQPYRHGYWFLHYVNNIFRWIDPHAFRCDGETIYKKIEDLCRQGKLNNADYNYHLRWECDHSKLECYLKLEQERAPMRPVVAQALAGFLPLDLYPLIVDYSAGKCDLVPGCDPAMPTPDPAQDQHKCEEQDSKEQNSEEENSEEEKGQD